MSSPLAANAIRAHATDPSRIPGPVKSSFQSRIQPQAESTSEETVMTTATAPVQASTQVPTPVSTPVNTATPIPADDHTTINLPRGNAIQQSTGNNNTNEPAYKYRDEELMRVHFFITDQRASDLAGHRVVDFTSVKAVNTPENVERAKLIAQLLKELVATVEDDDADGVMYDFSGIGRFAPARGQSIPSQLRQRNIEVRGVIGAGSGSNNFQPNRNNNFRTINNQSR